MAMFLAAMVCMMCINGCSQPKNIDAAEAAQTLLTEGVFAENLSPVSAKITNKRYGLTDDLVTETVAYCGTNAVVDEIAVFRTNNDNIDAVVKKAAEHIDAQTKTYESYRPDELSKLRDSIIVTIGDCVVVCVSSDAAKAQEIVDKLMKN